MIFTTRHICLVLALLTPALTLGACSTTRFAPGSRTAAPELLTPMASSTVQSDTLPPLGGTDGSLMTADGAGNQGTGDPALAGDPLVAEDGSFVSLSDVASVSDSGGRNLSGGLSVAKLLGTWTVSSDAIQCRINLTQTTKTGTNRYRASTPGCAIPALAGVASWQLAGTQIQLYDESGAIIGSLLQSENRFIGTLVGGVAVSMTG